MVTSAPLNQLDVTPRASRHAAVVIASDLDPSRPRGRRPTRHRGVCSVARRRRRRAPRLALPRARACCFAVVEGVVDALFRVDFLARMSTRGGARVRRSVGPSVDARALSRASSSRARVLVVVGVDERRASPMGRRGRSLRRVGCRIRRKSVVCVWVNSDDACWPVRCAPAEIFVTSREEGGERWMETVGRGESGRRRAW